MKPKKEIPIGGIGIINGVKVTVKEYLLSNTCNDCCFSICAGYTMRCPTKKCCADSRSDKKDVYFVEVKEEKQ